MRAQNAWLYWFVFLIVHITASSHPNGGCGACNFVWRKLNDKKVCFGAADGTNGKFNSQYGMNVYDFKYVRRNGYHECEYGFGGYFGCEMYPHLSGAADHHMPMVPGPPVYHVHMPGQRYGYYSDEPQHDEAQKDEAKKNNDEEKNNDEKNHDEERHSQHDAAQAHQGISAPDRGPGPVMLQGVSVFMTGDDDQVLMPQPPYSGAYFIIPGLQRPAWDTSIELHVYNGPMTIENGMELRMYHGEDLFNIDNADNSGDLCIDVYGYGDIVYSQ